MDNNLSLYYIFYTVANCGNISHASGQLFISQPAVSKAIRNLEDSLSTKLFTRSSRGVRLTDEGRLLYTHVDQAFSSLSLGEERLRDFRTNSRGHLRIGASTTLSKYVLLPGLRRFMAVYPNMEISLSCQSSSYTRQLLEEGKLDVGIIGTTSCKDPAPYESLGSVEDIFVASPACLERLGMDGSHFSPDALEKATLMLLGKDNVSRQYIDPYLNSAQAALHPYNILEIGTMDLLIEFAKIGLGIACVIQEFVSEELKKGTLVKVPLTPPIPRRNIVLACTSLPSAVKEASLVSYFRIRNYACEAEPSSTAREG